MNRKTESIRVKQLYGISLLQLCYGSLYPGRGYERISPRKYPYQFSGNVPVMRSVKEYTTTSDLETIGVFAYFTHGNFNEDAATPNFMYNQLVGKQTDGTWSYSPVKFWPDNSTTDKISFFAYAPYINETTGSNFFVQDKESSNGFPMLSYTVPTAENKQIDFLAATPVMNQNNGNVSFKLRHTLTKINVYVKSNDDTEGKSVTLFLHYGNKKRNTDLLYSYD